MTAVTAMITDISTTADVMTITAITVGAESIAGTRIGTAIGIAIAIGIAMTAIELAPKGKIPSEVHVFCTASSFSWLMLTLSWVTGRIASRLFRRLERPHATH